jgi:hypothetical protein
VLFGVGSTGERPERLGVKTAHLRPEGGRGDADVPTDMDGTDIALVDGAPDSAGVGIRDGRDLGDGEKQAPAKLVERGHAAPTGSRSRSSSPHATAAAPLGVR